MTEVATGAAAGDAARVQYLAERVALTLNCKSDKFKKLMAMEEASRPVMDFFIEPGCMRVFVADGGKELTCFQTPPANQKKKMIYFVKKSKCAVTGENVKDEVLHGDIAPQVLQHLFDATSDVYMPLLTNSDNQQGLPEVVVKDVMEYYHKLVSTIYVTSARDSSNTHRLSAGRVGWHCRLALFVCCVRTPTDHSLSEPRAHSAVGVTKGETLLPLPPLETQSQDKASKDKERVHVLESAVVMWTKQISAPRVPRAIIGQCSWLLLRV